MKGFFFVLAIALLASSAFANESSKLRIAFFTGLRYTDGFGDLSLNKYIIDEQIQKLRAQYGNNVQIDVVYLDEPESPQSTFHGRDVLKRMFPEQRYGNSLKRLDEMETRASSSTKPYYDVREKINFWPEKAFHQYIEQHPGQIDLGLMVSEKSRTVPEARDPLWQKYHLPSWISDNMNAVAFREYNDDPKKASSPVTLHASVPADTEAVFNPKARSVHMTVKVDTGPGAAGMIIGPPSPIIQKSTMMQSIADDLAHNTGKYSAIRYGETIAPKDILQRDPWLIVNRTNPLDRPTAPWQRSSVPVLMAYFHSQQNAHVGEQRPYLVFSNEEPISREEMFRALRASRDKLTDEEFKVEEARFQKFLDQRLLFLKPGGRSLSTAEMRSLFALDNGALFVQTGGYGTLGDSLAVGKLPLIVLRDYHQAFGRAFDSVASEIAERDYPGMGARVYQFLRESKELKADSELFNFTKEAGELEPILNKVAVRLLSEENISNYISDVVSVFYRAKKEDPGHVGMRVMADAAHASLDEQNHPNHFQETLNTKKALFDYQLSCVQAQLSAP